LENISKNSQHIYTNIRLRIDNLFFSEKNGRTDRHDEAIVLWTCL